MVKFFKWLPLLRDLTPSLVCAAGVQVLFSSTIMIFVNSEQKKRAGYVVSPRFVPKMSRGDDEVIKRCPSLLFAVQHILKTPESVERAEAKKKAKEIRSFSLSSLADNTSSKAVV